MTALPLSATDAVTVERLRVSVGGRVHVLDGPSARLGKVEFVRTPHGWCLHDRGVTGGLYLDGCGVRQLPLFRGRAVTVQVGPHPAHRLEVEVVPGERAEPRDDPRPAPPPRRAPTTKPAKPAPKPTPAPRPALVVDRLVHTTEEGRRLLDDVSFELPPSSLTAVIGPSGAGKSTLLRVLTGQATPASGIVLWNGQGLHEEHERLRFEIGLVPQEEILHQQLTVERALSYAARLRLAPDATRSQRVARVDGVIAQMGLERQRGHRIGSQLSGGQRKRVSIATELLTAPPLLFLDEPTSGLDPGLDRSVMQQLRGLADEGRVVVVATHSVMGLDACDRVVVLGRGGRLAYAGPPSGVLEHFGCADHPELFDLLESGSAPKSPRPQRRPGSARRVHVTAPPPRSSWVQLSTLVRRNLAVMLSDRLHLALLVLMPLVLAALSRVVQGEAGLSLFLTRDRRGFVDAAEVNQRLTILIVAAALMGAAMAIREVVSERSLFRREYAVGLSPGVYLLSKALVLSVICFAQGVLVSWLALMGLPEQDRGGVHGWGWWEIALPIGLLTAVIALVGLWISSLVRTVEQAMPALVGVVMVQLVMSSALVKLAGRPVLDQLSWLAPSRWAFAAASSSVDVDRSKRGVPGGVRDPLFEFTAAQWTQNLLCLGLLGLCAAVLSLRAVRRTARG